MYQKVEKLPELDKEVKAIHDFLGPMKYPAPEVGASGGPGKPSPVEEEKLPFDGPYDIAEEGAAYEGQWKKDVMEHASKR